MFTGLVQGIGDVIWLSQSTKEHLLYQISLPKNTQGNLFEGDSVSINGVCQTVLWTDQKSAYFEAVSKTLSCTNLDAVGLGTLVNVERSLRFGQEMGGHLLYGHIWGKVQLKKIIPQKEGVLWELENKIFPSAYLIHKGFVALEGVSLTIQEVSTDSFQVALVPYTLSHTTLGHKAPEDPLNIEFDYQLVQTYARSQPCFQDKVSFS